MAVSNPVKVKAANITSVNIASFVDGLDERGEYNASPTSFTYGRNVMVDSAGNVSHRYVLRKWLPSVVGMNGELSPVYYNNQTYFFIADDGVVKYIQEGDTAWTVCGGANAVTTSGGTITTFLRVNDILLILNDKDNSRYVDLATMDVVQFTHVDDPTSTLSATATGITTSGGSRVYYAITYNGDGGGETNIGPILSQSVSKSRSVWAGDGSEYLTIAFNDTPPAGATSRNLYMAQAIEGATPQASDLVRIATAIPIGDTSFDDDGQIPFDIRAGLAPIDNTTAGVKCPYGQEQNGIAILYGDPDNPYTIYFSGRTETGISFAAGQGAIQYHLNQGTNYYPTSVIGFRNNQNIPSLFVLSSNTKGVGKQSILTQKTITYGNKTITYWDAEEMNTGASGVRSPYGVVSYLNQLLFPSAEGITSVKTEANLQNVLSPNIITEKVSKTYNSISYRNFDKIVTAAWDNKIAFAVPSRGYNFNNQIMVYDLSVKDRPKWYIWDLEADWIGALTPPDQSSFLYIRKGRHFFRLVDSYVAQDEDENGVSHPFPTTVETSLLSPTPIRNSFFAVNQAVAYMAEFVGKVTMTVTYVNQRGKTKTKVRTFTHGNHRRNMVAGWSNPYLLYKTGQTPYQGWSDQLPINREGFTQKTTRRLKMRLPNPVVNEMKIRIDSDFEDTSYRWVNASFEGVPIGVLADIV